jgi:hypothetical protein
MICVSPHCWERRFTTLESWYVDKIGLGVVANEQLLHPILQTLAGSEWDWIKNLISSFNAGDIGKFDSLVNHFEAEVSFYLLDGWTKLTVSQS